jgi:dTDP-4-dehydrorhamnose reductase
MNHRVCIIGGTGMLGHKLLQVLSPSFPTFATIRGELGEVGRYRIFNRENTVENVDIEKFETVRDAMRQLRPSVVINAAGVIKQLPSSKNVVKTLEINSIFPHRLAELGRELNFRLITISTDCVFDGRRGHYSEDDVPDALDLYGQSKHLGEPNADNCLTLRTSIIGRELETAHSLVEWFLSNRGKQVDGYSNAIYSGFPTVVFARIIADLIERHPELSGLYHVSSEPISKFHLLRVINTEMDVRAKIVKNDDLKIDRSLNSDRFRARTGFTLQDWPEMIRQMAEDASRYYQWRT